LIPKTDEEVDMKVLVVIPVVIFALLLTGCSSVRHQLNNDISANVIAYKPDVRGAYIMKRADNSYVILSEPSPDVAKEFSANISAAAGIVGAIQDPALKTEFGNRVIDLARRSQTLQVLRESLFRLSEMIANGTITGKDARELYDRALRAVEMIALVELGNSGLPAASKERVIQDFYGKTRPGSITDTENEKARGTNQ